MVAEDFLSQIFQELLLAKPVNALPVECMATNSDVVA
jgi:hypothetical protein